MSASLFLTFLMVFAVGCNGEEEPVAETGDPEEEVAAEPAETEQEPEKDIYYVSVKHDSLLYMRQTPGSDGKPDDDVVGELSRRDEVKVLDKHDDSLEEDGYTWWEVYDSKGEQEGWVASEFLSDEKVEAVEYDPGVPFSWEEFGLEAEGLESEMSVEEVIEVMGAPEEEKEDMCALRGEMIQLHYEGLKLIFYDLTDTENLSRYEITSSNWTGPRNISVGDSAEEVLDKYPGENGDSFEEVEGPEGLERREPLYLPLQSNKTIFLQGSFWGASWLSTYPAS